MEIGMLWYDDDKKRPLAEKVERAANFYAAKYGRRPTDCHVHPSLLSDGGELAAGLRLHPDRTIIVNHFWMGIDKAVSE